MDQHLQKYKVMKFLLEAEELSKNFYANCALKFPDHKEFWGALVQEENNHVTIIRELSASMANEEAEYDSNKFNVEELESQLEGVRKLISEARGKDLSLKEALNVGLKLEESIMEKYYYLIAKVSTSGMKSFLVSIADSEEKHRKRFMELLEKIG
ncbi:MAG: ferritin family protein [Candidatus Omnitrophica bacterium]|nr:ferritin family protein [Candidatus Omnitrophota bacterium]